MEPGSGVAPGLGSVWRVSRADQVRWDEQWANAGPVAGFGPPPVPPVFAQFEATFPTSGDALDLGCGRGRLSLWLAHRGMRCLGLDVSPVAIGHARLHAEELGLGDRCRFEAVDLDDGLPDGPQVDLVACHLFRDPRLDQSLLDRLRPGGLVVMAVLSEVGHGAGRFRAPAGELLRVFGHLTVIDAGEADGVAHIVARS